MEIVTFTEQIAENSKFYPEFTNMRIVLNTETNEHRMEVYNDYNKFRTTVSISVKLKPPFNLTHKFGTIFLHTEKNRYNIVIKNSRNGSDRIYLFLSKYIYIINNKIDTEIFKDHEIDHRDGNKINDHVDNLCCLTSKHNKEKNKYTFWLAEYNNKNNSNYQEQDLTDINILNKVKQYFKPIISDIRKNRKEEYMEKYKIENKDSISKQRKEYREQNLELMKNASKEWRDNNKDYVKEKTKEYNDKNRDAMNERNMLSRRIEVLLKKEWTSEIGKLIKQYIERILELWNLTFEDISKGLSTFEYKHHTINNLNKLTLIYYEQNTRMND